MKKPSKQIRSTLLNALVIVGTIAIVIYLGARNGDIGGSIDSILHSDWQWLLIGVGVWAISIFCEALINQLFFIWQKVNIRIFSTVHITLLGMFYSNVTPAATGGQPMQVFAFKKRGVPVGVSSSSLAVKFFCFQAALLSAGVVLWLTQQDFVNAAVGSGKWLIFAGFGINGLSVAAVLLIAINRDFVRLIIISIMKLGHRLRLVKDLAASTSRADAALNDFSVSVDMVVHHPFQLMMLLLFSYLQLAFLMSASYCVYRALGLSGESPLHLLTLQLLLFIAASFTPLPGASGVQEGGFALFFHAIFPDHLMLSGLLLWRAVTYYLALLIGLCSVIFESARSLRINRRHGQENRSNAEDTVPVSEENDS
ncbi:MAG: flippase-like domain-containing protein [Clostridia bacterium]|nr:flippase-like domain-containing protein [Clostridia bacterium]